MGGTRNRANLVVAVEPLNPGMANPDEVVMAPRKRSRTSSGEVGVTGIEPVTSRV
jgi:hypothetical protein